jgi:TPR repeat protein
MQESELERRLRAAGAGAAESEEWLLDRLARGGRPGEDAACLAWLEEAAGKGLPRAQAALGAFHEQGRGGLARDDRRARQWYERAAAQGYARAQYVLGLFCEAGRGGFSADDVAARQWFERAAEQGFSGAEHNLGVLRLAGRGGLPQSDAAARSCFERAAIDNPLSQFALGAMAEAAGDTVGAAAWFGRAAAFGYDPARERMEGLQRVEANDRLPVMTAPVPALFAPPLNPAFFTGWEAVGERASTDPF